MRHRTTPDARTAARAQTLTNRPDREGSANMAPTTHARRRSSAGSAMLTTSIVEPVHVEPGTRAVTVLAGSLRLTLVHLGAERLAADLTAAVRGESPR